ncbi:M23 family metallopeptidase [Pseudonocardia endophytica]|uniref:M23 family metallopeptidase n=1 Tax=Pseudonocardia endophytica TaxID=401976 RepID=UPI001FB2C6C1|nr:M23 family metallopeptidase [Pseudonocardia endophytica]
MTGAGAAGGYRVGGPHVRHARGTSSGFPLQSRSSRVAAAVVAVGGVAGAAHASVQGTFLPDTQEMAGWFASSEPAPAASVPEPRTAADATIADGSTLAALAAPASARSTAATALTGATAPAAGRPASAVAGARKGIQDVRAAAAAPQAAPAASGGDPGAPAATAAAGGGVQILSGRVTSGFGQRWGTGHMGLDIAAPIGTPIHVPLAGTVISSGPASGFGLWVRVQHDDGTITVYGHINRSLVSVGEKVSAGQQIAEVGNRGQSTGPHLHIEVVQDGTKINPKPWLDEHGFRYT